MVVVFADLSSWVPHVYSIFLMVVAPVGILLVVPVNIVNQVYIGSVIAFVFICLWTLMQTYAAWWYGNRSKNARSIGQGESSLLLPSGSPPDEGSIKIAYLIPAYLNNEADILDDTIRSYCDMEFRGEMLVMIVFNSEGDTVEAEAELVNKWDGIVCGQSRNIRVRIVKNFDSTSKAENVNHGLSLIPFEVDYTAIMDADHQPQSNSASVATKALQREGYDVLQGACTIRNQDNFLSKMISVEFEHMYCVAHQGRFRVFNLGLFVGSNGYWKSSVLKEIQMDKSMLTEDVDSSVRAILAGYKIGQNTDVVSSELSPINRSVLQKQRLRWAQGWAEVSSKHAWSCIVSGHLTVRQKVGIVYLLGWREIFPYISFWPIWCVFVHALRAKEIGFSISWGVLGFVLLAFGFVRVAAAYSLCRGPIKSNLGAFVLFAIWGALYDIYLNHIQVCGHGRSLLNANSWVPTRRSE